MQIDRDRLKQIAAPLVVMAITAFVVLVLLGAARLQGSVARGADPADALTTVSDGVPAIADMVVWLPDGELQERVVEPTTRRSIEAAWSRAWNALQRAAAGDPSLLSTWFAGGALQQAGMMAGEEPDHVELSFSRHTLRITFYSDDGSVIGLRADPVRILRTVAVSGRLTTRTTDEAFSVVLLLEDGNWRIRQWERDSVVGVVEPLAEPNRR